MIKFQESNFYKSLQDFFINSNKETFLQFLAEFYNRTEDIINKNDNQDELIKELRELYLEFNEKGIDDNIVREKVNYFIENNGKLKDIIPKVTTNTNNIKNISSQLNNLDNNVNSLNEKINEVAGTGTTTEIVQSKVEDMAEKGLIQAYTLGNGTVSYLKIDDTFKNMITENEKEVINKITSSNFGSATIDKRWFCKKTIKPDYTIFSVDIKTFGVCTLIVELFETDGTNLIKTKEFTKKSNDGFTTVDLNYKTSKETYISVRFSREDGETGTLQFINDSALSSYTTDIAITEETLNITQLRSVPVGIGINLVAERIITAFDKIKGITPFLLSKEVTVDINGNGDYTSINSAISNTNEKEIIYIKEGEYQEAIKCFNKEIYLKGLDKERCKIININGLYANPPAEISCGIFENLTFYAKKTDESNDTTSVAGAYGVHIESDYSTNKKMIFKNCDFISDFYPAIGIGLRPNFTPIFENCRFYSNAETMTGINGNSIDLGSIYFHDSNTNLRGGQGIIFKNCEFYSKNKLITPYGINSDNVVNVSFINCVGYSENLGITNVVNRRNSTSEGMWSGNCIKLTKESFGNNIDELNYKWS